MNLTNFTMEELNELYYCVGTALVNSKLVNRRLSMDLFKRIADEIESRMDEPEYDSAGFTEDDRIVNDQYQNKELLDEAGAVQRWG